MDVKIDLKKLLGFKLLAADVPVGEDAGVRFGAKIGPKPGFKIGEKVGVKGT